MLFYYINIVIFFSKMKKLFFRIDKTKKKNRKNRRIRDINLL